MFAESKCYVSVNFLVEAFFGVALNGSGAGLETAVALITSQRWA